MKQTILSAGLLLILIIPASLSAEILYMKNGEIVRGRIVFQSSDSVSIQSEGRTRALNKADIRRISYNDEEEKTNEQRDNRLQQMMNRQQDLMVENNRLKQELARRDEAEKERAKTQTAAPVEAVTDRSSLWRSIVWSGWGQYHRGENKKGLIMMISSGVLFLNWYLHDRTYRARTDDLNERQNMALASGGTQNAGAIAGSFILVNEARNARFQAAQQATIAELLFLGFYAFNLYDIFFNKVIISENPSGAQATGLYLGAFPTRNGPVYSLSVSLRY